ncbi:alpha-1,3-mannosyl-glycoprotein 4-beta-N-acetylglucosaminyltransferase-like protein MGAT4D [Nycticebus coucang]|uniref:alpha-1,3-mannosyl-glycoprotein 4-beta-N-acetylglucosaminyltransferase-like protein MGAT4D n=1 Tax=Nycticebus coucang TaxID=9470 RepID=UPI00234CB473|nr:alpha-1,3-mannosyl-glycoprotein 4-beta-N-acetylglucosaminyltransferase-like protein MGAT4D [Nycticebus coucang]
MRTNQVNLMIALVAAVLFSFSCFSISRLTQTSNQLINCRNHISEFKENILRLKNKTEKNNEELVEALKQIKYENTQRKNSMEYSVEKTMGTLSKNEAVSNTFEELKFFFPHLKKESRIYPDVVISKGKTGVSFALGISTVNRRNYTYLKQTLTSVVSRMTPSEEKNCVVIISVADSNKDYLQSVVDLITKRFKRQVKSGTLEVISVPVFFYPNTLNAKQSTEFSQKWKSWHTKQLLDFCILMLYAQSKAMYYLQLEDDIIAKKMYLTKIRNFVHNITSHNWFYIEFSTLGFIGKLFRSKDLPEFVRFFLMFYKEKPIDLLLEDIFQVKMCHPGEALRNCKQRKKKTHILYKPSLFQHVGTHSSLPGKEQHYKREESLCLYREQGAQKRKSLWTNKKEFLATPEPRRSAARRRGGSGARGRGGAAARRLSPTCRCARAPGASRSRLTLLAAARACAVRSRCCAAGSGIRLGRRRDQVAAIRSSELPLPKTGPQNRCVSSRPPSRGPLCSGWGEASELCLRPSGWGLLGHTSLFCSPNRLNGSGPGEGLDIEFGDGGAASEGLGWALPALLMRRKPALDGGSRCHLGPAGLLCPPAALGLGQGQARRHQEPCPARPPTAGLWSRGEPSPLFQRLPFPPRSKLGARSAPPRTGEGSGERPGSAGSAAYASQNRKRNQNRLGLLNPTSV